MGPWREKGAGEDGADVEGLPRSILGLGTGPILPMPAAPAAPSRRSDASGPPITRSVLNLEADDRRPFPSFSSGLASPGASRSFLDLGDDARRPLPGLARPEGRLRPAESGNRSVLGLGLSGFAPAPLAPPPSSAFAHAPAGTRRPVGGATQDPTHEAADPTRGLFVEIERRPERAFPVERAILISLAFHIILLFVVNHIRGPGGTTPDFLAGLRPKAADDQIPIVYREAPGPERANPKRSDLSDKNRIAGGGDRTKPKSDTPFVPERPGKQGLAPGSPNAGAAPPAGTSRSAQGSPAERSPQTAVAEDRSASSDTFRAPTAGGSASAGLPGLRQSIEQAARGVGAAGEGGAGIPNPNGGFMDSGPLSFETSWYDWGAYADEMVRRIKLHWDIPKLAELGWKGKLTIHFDIRVDGSVANPTLISGSGIPPFDFAAMQAIVKSNPFRPLPKDLLKEVPGKEKEGVTVTFFYNMRPGREGSTQGGS